MAESGPRTDFSRVWGRADDGAIVEIAVLEGVPDQLDDRWPPIGLARCSDPPGPAEHLVAVGVHDGDGSAQGWDNLESELSLFAAERLAGLVAVHAALIVRDERALLLPGTSGAGKSTLCVAAAAAGAAVLTDEYALVDPTSGLVVGWRRPVRVRRADGSIERRRLAVESGPTQVGLVAFVAHEAGAPSSWGPITPAAAVLELLANTVCARSRPDEALDAALAIARNAPAIAGVRGEAAEAIDALLTLLDDPSRVPTAQPPAG